MNFSLLRSAVLVAPLLLVSTSFAKTSVTSATYTGSVNTGTSPATITGIASLTGITTSEGTFTTAVNKLTGATAANIVSANSNSSIGYNLTGTPTFGTGAGNNYPPSTNDATGRAYVTSGLTVNDGVNNLQSGDFQFSSFGTFDINTRFLVIDSYPTPSGSAGDPFIVTLINASNQVVGSFTPRSASEKVTPVSLCA